MMHPNTYLNWKLTLLTLGDVSDLLPSPPFEHVYDLTDKGELHLYTWLFDQVDLARDLDNELFDLMTVHGVEHYLAAFHCEGTWEKIELQ